MEAALAVAVLAMEAASATLAITAADHSAATAAAHSAAAIVVADHSAATAVAPSAEPVVAVRTTAVQAAVVAEAIVTADVDRMRTSQFIIRCTSRIGHGA